MTARPGSGGGGMETGRMPGRRVSRLRQMTYVVLSAVLVVGGSLLVATPAHAAAPVSVDNVYFENTSFPDGSRQSLHVDWSIPDAATNPVTMELDFPEGLTGFADTFDMLDPDGQRAGTCTVTASAVTCTVDPSFINSHPLGVSGSFWFDVSTNLKNKEDEQHTFDFGGISQTVTVEANPNWCTDNCAYTGQSAGKYGSYNNADDTIIWTVRLPAGAQGIDAGKAITVTDHLDSSQFELITDGTYPRVLEGTSLVYNQWDREVVSYATKPAAEVTWSGDNLTASFTSVPGAGQGADLGPGKRGTDGSFYQVQWKVKVLDEGKARKYTNSASYTIEGQGGGSTSGTATRYSGGATVVGRNFGRFQVTKAQHGDTTLRPEFAVRYQAYDGDTLIDEGTFKIKSGQSYISDEYFKGTRIVLSEVKPTEPANVAWDDPVFEGPDGKPLTELTFSADNGNLGQITQITLVNRGMLKTAPFTAKKVVDNPNNVPLPADLQFRIAWGYDARPDLGFTFKGGSFNLPADGTVVTTEPFPVGAEVFLQESTPDPIPGATWGTPQLSTDTVTIGEQNNVEVTVTNTITQDLGGFSITKSMSGDGQPLVSDGAEFTVNYSYTSVNGFPAGSGQVRVKAGDTSPVVDDIPAGATVTLDEVTPTKPEGGTWGEPQFDVASFTVTKDQVSKVSLDNPITWDTGTFSVTKAVDGTGADLVSSDTAFTVGYTYTLPDGLNADPNTGEGTLTVHNDGTAVTSEPLPYGTKVTLTETPPAAIAGGTWGAGVFDQPSFTIGDHTTTAVTLTNTITKDVGAFSIAKTITGTGQQLVDPGTKFTVDYSYPAGDGFAAGTGSVQVSAGGEPVVVHDIPAGAILTLTEAAPDNPTGGTWGTPTFIGGDTITIVKDQTVAVDLENTIAMDQTTPTPTPSPTPTGSGGADPDNGGTQPPLANTGVSGLVPMVVVSLVLLLAGIALVAITRRRRNSATHAG